jgi:[ribosomal protein S18]-alanine N-acetyltransferase
VISIALKPLPETLLSAAVELDRAVLSGLWNAAGYRQELERSSSNLLGLWPMADDGPLDNGLLDNSDSTLRVVSSTSLLPPGAALPNSQILLMGMGCSWTILDETHLVLLAVHPKFQRQGFGCAILLGLLTCAIAHGSNYATLEVRASNQVAIALYETFGFKTAGRRPHYYSDPRSNTSEDALILWRSGLQTAEFKTQTMQRWQSLERRWANQHWKIASPFEEILR